MPRRGTGAARLWRFAVRSRRYSRSKDRHDAHRLVARDEFARVLRQSEPRNRAELGPAGALAQLQDKLDDLRRGPPCRIAAQMLRWFCALLSQSRLEL
jgi:hypothetical protein